MIYLEWSIPNPSRERIRIKWDRPGLTCLNHGEFTHFRSSYLFEIFKG